MEEPIVCISCGLRADDDPDVEFIPLDDGAWVCIHCADDDSVDFLSRSTEDDDHDF